MKEFERVNEIDLDGYKELKRIRCTMMSNGWTDGNSRSITNSFANSPHGTVLLQSLDNSTIFTNGKELFRLLDLWFKNNDKKNVMQVIIFFINSDAPYVYACLKWRISTRSYFRVHALHICIDNLLKDIGDLHIHKNIIEKTKKIMIFIHFHY